MIIQKLIHWIFLIVFIELIIINYFACYKNKYQFYSIIDINEYIYMILLSN